MGRKDDVGLLVGEPGQFLFDFTHVPVGVADVVRRDAIVHFHVEIAQLQAPPGAADARLGVHDDLAGVDGVRFEQRGQSEDHARGIAARIAHEVCCPNAVPVQFGNPVDRRIEQFRRRVWTAVPGRVYIGVVEPEIGTDVHDAHAPLQEGADPVHGHPVRRAETDHVRGYGGNFIQGSQRSVPVRIDPGKDLSEVLPGILFRRGENDLDAGMSRRQPVQFHAGIPRRADNAQFDHVPSLFSFMIPLMRLSVFLAWPVDLVTRSIVFSPATLPTISDHSARSIASHTPDA